MQRARILSLKRKIAQGKVKEVVDEVLSQDGALPAELLCEIREIISAGYYLDSRTMGNLVLRTRDAQLFLIKKARASMF